MGIRQIDRGDVGIKPDPHQQAIWSTSDREWALGRATSCIKLNARTEGNQRCPNDTGMSYKMVQPRAVKAITPTNAFLSAEFVETECFHKGSSGIGLVMKSNEKAVEQNGDVSSTSVLPSKQDDILNSYSEGKLSWL